MLDQLAEWCVASEALGERIKRLRHAAGLSQDALGRLCGVTGQAIWLIEAGRRKSVYPETAARLANALGVSEYYLLSGREPEAGEHVPVEVAVTYRQLDDIDRERWILMGRLLRETRNPRLGDTTDEELGDVEIPGVAEPHTRAAFHDPDLAERMYRASQPDVDEDPTSEESE